jgi:hypothetical protein
VLYHILTPVLLKGNTRLPLFAATQFDVWLDEDGMRKVFPVSGEEFRKLLKRLRPTAST